MRTKGDRAVALFLAGGLAILAFPGCLGVAVRGINQTVSPEQPLLRDSIRFDTGNIQATAVLLPVRKGRSGAAALLFGGGEASNQPVLGYEPASPEVRMALWTVLANRSQATEEVEVQSEVSPLGTIKDKRVALAPGQKVVLEPIWSAKDQNLQNLDVTLTLKVLGIVEERKLALGQMRNP